jgi:hypothetical protein
LEVDVTQDEWGPWIEWSGGKNPAPGMYVAIEIRGQWKFGPIGNPDCDRSEVWAWFHDGRDDDITRYRIRKPRGMVILEKLLIDLPETVDA